MRVVIAGGHGKIARHLGRMLSARGDAVVGLIRNPDHAEDLRADGVDAVTLDLESAEVAAVEAVVSGADAAVFAAGAGPGSGVARKDTVDRAASALLAEACAAAGVRRFLQISSMGAGAPRNPDGVGEVFGAYLDAKRAAEQDLRVRDLDWTILRPGVLTDDPDTGEVLLGASVRRAAIARADVAAVLVALLDEPGTSRRALEVVNGDTPIEEAVRAALS